MSTRFQSAREYAQITNLSRVGSNNQKITTNPFGVNAVHAGDAPQRTKAEIDTFE